MRANVSCQFPAGYDGTAIIGRLLRGRPAGKYYIPIDFGAIGSGLPAAIGVAAARNNGPVLLIDGDGSLYQHIQELETVRRHGVKLFIYIINDGGHGAETHEFRAHGVDPVHATHGRGDLAQVARGFGLNGTKVTSLGQFKKLFREHRARTVPLFGTCMSTT